MRFCLRAVLALALAGAFLMTGCDVEPAGPDETPPTGAQFATVQSGWALDQQYLFVIHRPHGTVSRLNIETLEAERVKVGEDPFTMAITPDGTTVLVVSRGEQTLSIIDAQTLSVRKAYIGVDPRDVAVRSDGRYAAVASYESDSFSLIDLEDLDIEPFYCGGGPTSVRFTADDSALVATSYWTPGICVLDIESRDTHDIDLSDAVDEHFHVEYGAQSVVPGPDGSGLEHLAFVSLRDHYDDGSALVVTDWRTGEIEEVKPLGAAPASLAIDPRGRSSFRAGQKPVRQPQLGGAVRDQ